jgi:cation transport ATPase
MRRGCSVILFVAGAWILASVGIVGLIPADEQISPWAMVGIFAGVAAPFLLIGTWMSPGRRMAELGLTLMISAGVALMVVITMAAVSLEPAFQRLMPEPMPKFDFTSPAMVVSLLLIGGGGYLLRRLGTKVDPGSSPG